MRRLGAAAAAGCGLLCATAVAATASPRAAVSPRATVSPAAPAAASETLAGSCTFSGPITPNPPITVVPKPDPHFSFNGTGACTGTLGTTTITKAPITLTFTDVETAFDTCEFGPDFNLHGVLSVPQGASHADFPVVVNLARLAVAGPLTVTTDGGGKASGTATFSPANPGMAVIQCGTSGVATATLAGSFTTSAPFVGTLVTPPPAKTAHRHHRSRHHVKKKRKRPHR